AACCFSAAAAVRACFLKKPCPDFPNSGWPAQNAGFLNATAVPLLFRYFVENCSSRNLPGLKPYSVLTAYGFFHSSCSRFQYCGPAVKLLNGCLLCLPEVGR